MTNGTVCTNCGEPIKEEDTFCMNCGIKIHSTTDLSQSVSIENQQNESLNNNSNEIQFTSTSYIEPTETATTENQAQNYIGIISIIIDALGIGFFVSSVATLEWIGLGFGVVGVIVGIVGYSRPNKKGQAFLGIALGLILIAAWLSIYFDLF